MLQRVSVIVDLITLNFMLLIVVSITERNIDIVYVAVIDGINRQQLCYLPHILEMDTSLPNKPIWCFLFWEVRVMIVNHTDFFFLSNK